MSGSVNKVMLLGNLCRDPEVRTFQNGGKVCNLRIATSEKWKDRDGNKQEKPEYHSIAVFQEGAVRFAEQYLKKGDKVYVEGKLETRKWQDQSGQDRYSTEVTVRPYGGTLTALSTGQNNGGNGGGYGGGGGYDQSPGGYRDDRDRGPSGGAGGQRDIDQEIPFAPEWRA